MFLDIFINYIDEEEVTNAVEAWIFEHILKKWKITIELLLMIYKDIIVLINNYPLINLCLRNIYNFYVYSNTVNYRI